VPLQLYFNNVSNNVCAEISEFALWYLSNIESDKEKLALLSHCNLYNVSTLNYSLIKSYHFGSSLFKRIITAINCHGAEDVERWAKILEVAIQITKDTLSAVKIVIHKYRHDRKLIIKLLATPNHHSQNAFYNVSSNCPSRAVMKYIVSFINEENSRLLLQPSYAAPIDGNTALHRVINDVVRGCMVTRKFDSEAARVLFTKNDAHQYVLDNARSSEVTLILLKQLSESQLIQTFADNITDKKLHR